MHSQRESALRRRRRRCTLAVLCAFTPIASAVVVPAGARASGVSGSPQLDGRERAVIGRINAVRGDHGLAAITLLPGISHAADRHAARQLSRRTLSHRLPGEASLRARLGLGSAGRPVGEVVLWASGTRAGSASVVRTWMDSPPHRALLLSPNFSLAGIGIRAGGGGLYATVDLTGR